VTIAAIPQNVYSSSFSLASNSQLLLQTEQCFYYLTPLPLLALRQPLLRADTMGRCSESFITQIILDDSELPHSALVYFCPFHEAVSYPTQFGFRATNTGLRRPCLRYTCY
jgi:hypothetical protein